jgi:hypothetical protein
MKPMSFGHAFFPTILGITNVEEEEEEDDDNKRSKSHLPTLGHRCLGQLVLKQ